MAQALNPGCKGTPDFDADPVEIINCITKLRARFRKGLLATRAVNRASHPTVTRSGRP